MGATDDEGPREGWDLDLDLEGWDAQFDALTGGGSGVASGMPGAGPATGSELAADTERVEAFGAPEATGELPPTRLVEVAMVEVAEAGGAVEVVAPRSRPMAPPFVDEGALSLELEASWEDEELEVDTAPEPVLDDFDVGDPAAAAPALVAVPEDAPTPAPRLPARLPPPTLHFAAATPPARADDLDASHAFFEARLALIGDQAAPGAYAATACAAASCALAMGDAEAAHQHYQAALRVEPSCTPALRGLRRLALSRGDLSGALAWLDRELRLVDEQSASWPALAVLRAELSCAELRRAARDGAPAQGASEAARAAFAELFAAQQAGHEAGAPLAIWARLGLLELAPTDDARREQQQALAACTDDGALAAALLVEAGRTAPSQVEMARCFREALTRDPSSLAAALGLLQAALCQGATTQSVSDERMACERLGALVGGALREAFVRRAAQLGRVAGAPSERVADVARPEPTSGVLPVDEAGRLLAAGRVREAAAALSRLALERRLAGEQLAGDLLGERAARLHLRAGDRDEALAELRVLKESPSAALASRACQLLVEHAPAPDRGGPRDEMLGEVSDGPHDEPTALVELAASATPRTRSELRADALTSGLWYRHALLVAPRDPVAARTSLRWALALWPKHLPALVALEVLGDRIEAARIWLRRLGRVEMERASAPLTVALGLRAASSLAAGSEWASACECLVRILPVAGAAAPLVEERLLLLARESGDAALLRERLAAGLPADDRDGKSRFLALVRLAEREEQVDAAQAIAHWREALTRCPESPLAREGLERALLGDGRMAELEALLAAETETARDVHRRAAAHLRLASLYELAGDGAGTGDAAAIEHWQSLLQLDPRNHQAVRALERTALLRRDLPGRIAIYEHLGLVATDDALAVAAILERAAVREQLGGEHVGDLEADLRQALYKAPRCRPALRRLLSLVERAGEPRALAALCDRLADDLGRDPLGALSSSLFREQATRAWERLGEPREALGRRVEALARGGAQAATIRELLGAALASEAWTEAADAAEAGGRDFRDPRDRLMAWLALGAIADRLGDGERALAAFRGALVEQPEHREAVQYVLGELQRRGDRPALAVVLAAWAASEPDPALAAQAHLDAARLQRSLGETRAAEHHLVAALALEPAHREVLAELSDVQYQAGSWAAAAETLMRYVRVERDAAALHKAWRGLGLIYAERLPDPARAIACFGRVVKLQPDDREALGWLAQLCERQGDARNAREALARLTQLEARPEERISLLLRGALLDEKLGKPRVALDGLRQALALDPLHRHSVAALATFFERQGDAAAARVHLDTSLQLLRQALAREPSDPALYRAVFRVFALRRDPDAAGRAASLLVALGAAGEEERAFLQQHPGDEPPVGARLSDPALADLLFDAAIPPGFRHLFRLLDEPLQKFFRGDVKRFGVERSERLPKEHGACELAAQLAAELGAREPELYVTRAFPTLLALEPGEPTAIVLGERLVSGDARGLRFFLARSLVLAQAGLTVPLRMSPAELVLLVGAVVRQFVPDFMPRGLDAPQVLVDEAARLARIVPRKLHADLLPFALECAAPELDYREVALRLVQSGNRAGLLASGSVAAALAAVRKLGDEAQTAALLRYAVSDELGALRRALGVARA